MTYDFFCKQKEKFDSRLKRRLVEYCKTNPASETKEFFRNKEEAIVVGIDHDLLKIEVIYATKSEIKKMIVESEICSIENDNEFSNWLKERYGNS